MKKILLLILFITIGAINLNAQQRFKGFSGQVDTYLGELKEMLESDVNLKSDAKKDFEQLLEEYEQSWTNFSIQHRKDIAKLSQSMFKKNIRIRNGFLLSFKLKLLFNPQNKLLRVILNG